MKRAPTLGDGADQASDGVPEEPAVELVRRYARLIRFAMSRVAGPEASRIGEDVEQRVGVQLFRQLASEQEIQHPASYIYRVAVRETVRMLRGEARAERGRAAALELARAAAASPHRELAFRELKQQVEVALGSLGDDRRRATRAHLAGFQVTEIMGMYGWTYNRARNLIARGMADLRRELRARGIDG